MPHKFTVLYVDDERGNLNAFRNTFRRDYNVLTAESADEGLRLLESQHVDLVLSDQRMPGMSGVEFLKSVIKKHPDPHRILVTAYSDFDAIQSAINEASIFRFVQKPWDTEEFKAVINQALEVYDLRRQNEELASELGQKCQELERANQELRDSDQLKYDFLKIISHEIRTPLNGLKGSTQLFKLSMTKGANEETDTLFELLEASTERLEQFLILAERITSLKAKQYTLACGPADVSQLLHYASAEVQKDIERNEQELIFDLCDQNIVEADSQILCICLKEVLRNASKHSPRHTKIFARTRRENGNLIVEISDQGNAIPETVLRNLFKIFVRDPKTRDQSLGLNLALTKLVMDLHGGEARVFNNSEGGATVQLVLAHSDMALAAAR